MKFWFSKETRSETVAEEKANPVEGPDPDAVPSPRAEVPPQELEEPVPRPEIESPVVKDEAVRPMSNPKVNQRDLYCRLMNGLYDAILILDAKGHVVDCNERVNAIFGYTCDDVWDKPVGELVHNFGPRLLAQIAEPLNEHRPVIVDGRCQRRDGSVFTAEIAVGRVSLVRGENIVLSIRDVEKRIAAVIERLHSQPQETKGLVRLVRTDHQEKK